MEEESISTTNADSTLTTVSVIEPETSENSNLTTMMINDTLQQQNDSELTNIKEVLQVTSDEPSNAADNTSIPPNNNNTILNNNNIDEIHQNNNPDIRSSCKKSVRNSEYRNGKRSVTFPDDQSLVIGFLEPYNPWKNAPICTAEELVDAYKKGCKVYDVKPWNKIIQQLLNVKNCWNRHKSFVLQGEQLDHKHCEALEEVFRRVQFESIVLKICDLDDGTAEALFDMIEYYDSTMKLNMSFNKDIGIRGWQACSNMIRKTPSLHYLDARGCQLNDCIITIFGRSLKLGSNLTVLHLENTSITENCLLVLVEALKRNEVLQELFLGDNKLGPKNGNDIGNLLKFNSKLQLLDLRNNQLQDTGLGKICQGLCQKLSPNGINTLVLWNNQISHLGMPYLAEALAKLECLETLNLGNNNITNEGIHYLKDGLLKSKSLIRLGLQNTKILCEGAVALAEYIADSSRILHIDLCKNNIRTAGLMALSLALKVNQSLVRLELDKTTKKEVAVKDYANQQQRLLSDISNYLERNHNVAVKKENEQQKKAEELAKKQEAEKLAVQQKRELENLESAYFPTCNRIRRPTLLFATEPSPQKTLDSPAFISDAEFSNQINSPLVSTVSPMSFKTISSPPGDFLLSPQYCENTKAKKIFTVTKVGDVSPSFQHSSPTSLPTSPTTLGISSPTSVDQVLLNFDPNHSSRQVYTNKFTEASEICKEIAAETISGLFGITVKDTNNKNESTNGKNKSFQILSPSEKLLSPNVKTAENSLCENRTETCTDSTQISNNNNDSNTNVSNINNKKEYLGNDNNDNSDTNTRQNKTDANKTVDPSECAATNDTLSVINNCDSRNSSSDDDDKTPEIRVQSPLDLSDVSHDISTILDSLELNSNTKSNKSNQHFKTDVISTPEEYEKELDDMLAQVQKDHNIISQ
ncbi:protein phosphatase 1 regulatory subunit 37 isoform X1 [Octopus bimaculoides]|uniref:Protein phosphatase 1 regulatory subunit 37 n=1 Tax=Octopus bimaculoides TaxID=37653 RepID=A0A0L8GIN9_OCTBM|nr:protein phosphatase 1 regulatory subunit 37 isoform X1 [Octopus bimaculoides]|eukprot:XP_014780741.1 PREDICTED: protein phosphatase 1 regulatory subunit 37-like isoform X1 [Octopus bimaculoides]